MFRLGQLAFVVALVAGSTGAAQDAGTLYTGLVLDMRDEPIPAAEVWLVRLGVGAETIVHRGRTDAEGRYRLVDPDGEWCLVRARAEGMATGEAMLGSARVRLHECATVTGRIETPAGRPARGVVVRARPDEQRFVPVDAETDAQGRFRLQVPLGSAKFSALTPDGFLVAEHHVTADAAIELRPLVADSTTLTVTVLGLPKAARGDARVLVEEAGSHLHPSPPAWASARLDGDGRFTISELPDVRWDVRVMADGYSCQPPRLELRPGNGPQAVTFTARPIGQAQSPPGDGPAATGTVSGRLWSADGSPVSGRAFTIEALLFDRWFSAQPFRQTTTDADGRFRIDGMTRSNTTYRIRCRGLDESLASRSFRFGDGDGRVEMGDLRLVRAATIAGTVTDRNGEPLAGRRVYVRRVDHARHDGLHGSVRITDRAGRFRFRGVVPGDVEVFVGNGGTADEPGTPILAESGEQHAVELILR